MISDVFSENQIKDRSVFRLKSLLLGTTRIKFRSCHFSFVGCCFIPLAFAYIDSESLIYADLNHESEIRLCVVVFFWPLCLFSWIHVYKSQQVFNLEELEIKKMHRADRRRRRSSESGLEQTNGECGGEVNPAVDKEASEQSNGSVPLNQSEADNHTEETPNVGNENENGHLREEMVENGKGMISNGVSCEEEKPTPETGKKTSYKKRSDNRSSGSHRELVLGLPCKGQFEIFRSRNAATSSKRRLGGGGGGERNVQFSSHKRAQRSKEAAASSSVDRPKKRKKDIIKKGKVVEDDEYTRIKKKLRYLLNRINYEQSLIDAYSLEGWKGSRFVSR